MRGRERKIVLLDSGGIHIFLLGSHPDLDFEFLLVAYPSGSSTGEDKYKHEGLECGYLLQGELVVEIEDRKYHLAPHDSITFRPDVMHRINNKGEKTAKAIWVNSKPWIFSTR